MKRYLRRVRTALVGPPTQADRPIGRKVLNSICIRALALIEPAPGPMGCAPPYAVFGVYRARNAANVATVLRNTPRAERVCLWALDRVADQLETITLGSGPGTRFANLNRCVSANPRKRDEWIVLADDDVAFDRGSIELAIATAFQAGLDLAQVSHSRQSFLNWSSELHRPFCKVRLSRFAEQGPLLILSPKAAARLLPFPEDVGMGWGIEAQWAADPDLRIGTVDTASIRHLNPVSWTGAYDVQAELAASQERLEGAGYATWAQLQTELARWRVWRRDCPWQTDLGSMEATESPAKPGSAPCW